VLLLLLLVLVLFLWHIAISRAVVSGGTTATGVAVVGHATTVTFSTIMHTTALLLLFWMVLLLVLWWSLLVLVLVVARVCPWRALLLFIIVRLGLWLSRCSEVVMYVHVV
jgi:hypothetical protein